MFGAASTTSSGTGFTFGAPGTSTDSSGGFSGFNFGATTTSGATGATSTGGYGGFSFSGSTPSSSAAPGFNFGAAKLVCQLEDTMNKWTAELEEQEKYFLEQATQVNAWDRVVMENGEKIVQLNKDVEKVKLNQQKLDHELDFVQSQEKELEDILVPLEKALDSMPPINYQQHADIEREHTYILAESLDAQLKRMGQDLTEIIERLNATKVHRITKILNAHFMSLMWVDRNTANLQKRVEEISKQMEIERREQEKNFRLAYS